MIRFCFLVFCLILPFVSSAQEKDKVVIGSTYGDDIPQNVRSIFMNTLSSGLTNSGRFIVLANRDEFITKVGDERRVQDAGYIDDNQMLELGRASGADYVIYARVDMFEEEFLITFQMMELKTGISVRAPEPIITDKSGLLRTARKMALDLASGNMSAGEKSVVTKEDVPCLKCLTDEGMFTDGYIDGKDRTATTWNDAVLACENKGDGWRLPTIEETKIIYQHQRSIADAGGKRFQTTTYWTSSLRNNFSVYSLDFSDGSRTYISKTSRNVYRCVYQQY